MSRKTLLSSSSLLVDQPNIVLDQVISIPAKFNHVRMPGSLYGSDIRAVDSNRAKVKANMKKHKRMNYTRGG
jgi:hypothetical protein